MQLTQGLLKRTLNKLLLPLGVQVIMAERLKEITSKSSRAELIQRFFDCDEFTNSARLWLIQELDSSKSQIQQDLIALMITNQISKGYFVEFGAASGKSGSNTYLLEKKYGWNGIVAEPARVYRNDLHQWRSCHIDYRCVYSSSDIEVDFLESKTSMLSTILGYEHQDSLSKDRKISKLYKVQTVSLNDLLDGYNAPKHINYMSVDTEGTELEILSKLDFQKYSFDFLSIEHNSVVQENAIEELMNENGYVRILRRFSRFDSWFVPKTYDTGKWIAESRTNKSISGPE
jgi:FkbM family methyltransferase